MTHHHLVTARLSNPGLRPHCNDSNIPQLLNSSFDVGLGRQRMNFK